MIELVAALLYLRVSDDEQADAETLVAVGKKPKKKAGRNGLSIGTQRTETRRYAAYHQDWVIHEEYRDVLSGKRSDRPDYQRLLADAKALRAQGRRVAVVVAALDRFGRSVRERVECWEALTPLGVEFHSVREGGLQQEWMYNLLAGLAQEESRRLGERVAKVRANVRENGWKAPGRAALGYRWRPSDEDEQRQGAPESVLEPDPTTAPYAREAFERASGGASTRSVTRWLASLPAEMRGGHEMSFRAVQKMLRAPVYVARPDYGDPDVLARPVGRWEALVSDEDWSNVQARTEAHKKTPRQASGRYLLSGLLYCPRCGERLCGSSSPGGRVLADGRRAIYAKYRCERRVRGAVPGYHGPTACEMTVSVAAMDAAVLAKIEPVLALADANPIVLRALRRTWREIQEEAAPDPGLRARIAQLERSGVKARERLKRAALMLVDGTLDKAGYDEVRQQAEHDLDGASEELGRLRGAPKSPALPDVDEALRQLGGWAEVWRGEDIPERRAVLAKLIERVVPVRVGHGMYTADITWTALGAALGAVTERVA